MMPEKCADCRWWEPKGTEQALRGSCLFLPPKIQNVIVGEEDTYFVYSYFPETNRNQRRCGRFAARETAKPMAVFVTSETPNKVRAPGEPLSPLAERGFRLIDKELWEKEIDARHTAAKQAMSDRVSKIMWDDLSRPPTSTVEEKIAELVEKLNDTYENIAPPYGLEGKYYMGKRDGMREALDLIRAMEVDVED